MKIDEINNWSDVIRYILSVYPPTTPQTEVAKEIGISWASYQDLKKNKPPKAGYPVDRSIRQFFKDKFGYEIKGKGSNVQVYSAEKIEFNAPVNQSMSVVDYLENKLKQAESKIEQLEKELQSRKAN